MFIPWVPWLDFQQSSLVQTLNWSWNCDYLHRRVVISNSLNERTLPYIWIPVLTYQWSCSPQVMDWWFPWWIISAIKADAFVWARGLIMTEASKTRKSPKALLILKRLLLITACCKNVLNIIWMANAITTPIHCIYQGNRRQIQLGKNERLTPPQLLNILRSSLSLQQ